MQLPSNSGVPQACPGRSRRVSLVLGDLGRIRSLLTLFLLVLLFLGAGDSARLDRLGQQLICMCGCNQSLVGCNHLHCPYRGPMMEELTAAVDRGDSDSAIIQFFVQKYGTLVLPAPTNTGFDRLAWLMPFVALLGGITLVVIVVWAWKKRPAAMHASIPAPVRGDDLARFREQVNKETRI